MCQEMHVRSGVFRRRRIFIHYAIIGFGAVGQALARAFARKKVFVRYIGLLLSQAYPGATTKLSQTNGSFAHGIQKRPPKPLNLQELF